MSNVFVIAEAGVNHNGEKDKAFELVDIAAAAGADAVKFQTFNAERLVASSAPKAAYQKERTDAQESQLAMLKRLELPLDWHLELQGYARQKGVTFLSTAFDLGSLEFLETLNLPCYKIPSGEITNGPLLWAFANTGKPLILSTGMATLGEVEQALAVVLHGRTHSAAPASMEEVWRGWHIARIPELRDAVTLLHCTSQYPTPLAEVNLRAMDTLGQAFDLPVGYSDHTEGTVVSVAAVARGAKVIEKHFTISRALPGPDHKASLEPHELASMMKDIRAVEQMLGAPWKSPQISEWDTRGVGRQVLIATRNVTRGERFSVENMASARAGKGRSAMEFWDALNELSNRDLKPGEAL